MSRVTLISRNAYAMAANEANLSRASRLQEQLASGKRVEVMSDDPVAARRALALRVERFQGQSHLANIDRATAALDATDVALEQMAQVLASAKRIAVEGANGTLDSASREALAVSVEAHLNQLITLANSSHAGRSLFAGTAVDTAPFALSADGSRVEYHGDQDQVALSISTTETSVINQNGQAYFQDRTDLFDALIRLRDALRADDPTAVDELIADVDAGQARLGTLQGELGGRQQRLDLSRSVLESFQLQLGALISQEVDTDLAATIQQLQAAQVALESGLNTSARILQSSLLDYLSG